MAALVRHRISLFGKAGLTCVADSSSCGVYNKNVFPSRERLCSDGELSAHPVSLARHQVRSRCSPPAAAAALVVLTRTSCPRLRTVMKSGAELVKVGFKSFFENAAEDLEKLVEMLKLGKFMQSRAQLKSVTQSINYVTVALLPILTALFEHITIHQFAVDLIRELLSASAFQNHRNQWCWCVKHTECSHIVQWPSCSLYYCSGWCAAVLLSNPDVFLQPGNWKECLCGEVRVELSRASSANHKCPTRSPYLAVFVTNTRTLF